MFRFARVLTLGLVVSFPLHAWATTPSGTRATAPGAQAARHATSQIAPRSAAGAAGKPAAVPQRPSDKTSAPRPAPGVAPQPAAAQTEGRKPAAGDYIEHILKRGVVRWEEGNRPIPVYIDSGKGEPDFNPAYLEILKASFAAWQQAGNEKLSFTYVTEPNEAEIVCSWTGDPAKRKAGIGAEHVSLLGHDKTIGQARLTIPFKDAAPLSLAQMRPLCLHAVGHALGLSGHSDEPGDAMYPFFSGQRLSERDANTLRRLYSDDPAVVRAEPPRIDTASLDEIGRLIHDATTAATAGDVLAATAKFEQAYAMDSTRPELAHNLCACYSRLASQRYREEKFQEAEAYIRKAVPMCERGATRQVLAGVLNNLVAILQATGRHEEAARFMMEHASLLSLVMDSPMKKARAVQLEEEARQLSAKKLPEQAEAKIRQALEVEPDSAYLYSTLGRYLLDQAKFEEAAQACKKAISLNPKSAGAWLSLAACCQRLGRSREGLEAYQKLLEHQPQFPGADIIGKAIADLEKEIAEQDKANASGPDYIATALDSGPYTWKYWQGPIPVYIKDGSSVLHFLPSFPAILKQSFAEWEEALGRKLTFAYVDRPEQAKIMCEWTDDPSVLEKKDSRGVTRVIPTKDRIAQARIYLLTQDSSRTLAERDMHSVCLHEIGHALGISGHSPNPSDIMYKASYVQALAPRDVATLTRIYSDETLVAGGPAPAQAEAGEPQEESGPRAQLRKLANQATEAANSGHYKAAVKVYEQALAMDPYHPVLQANLCACYNNLAAERMKRRKMRDAEQYLRKAVELCERAQEKDQLAGTLHNLALVLNATGRRDEAAQVRERAQSLAPRRSAAAQVPGGDQGSVASATDSSRSKGRPGEEQPTLTAMSTTAGAGEHGTHGAMAAPAQGTLGVRLIMVPVGYRRAKVNLCEAPNKTVPDVDVPVGVWVGPVAPGSPAQECGLKESDAIVALDGVSTVGISPREFCSRWVGAPGTAVKVTVARRNDRIDCNCRRVSPRELLRDPSDADDTVLVSGIIGVKVRPKVVLGGAWSYTTISINESYEFEVEEVYPGSPAQDAGLKPGDVIYAVDGHRVDRQNFADAISGQPGTDVDLSVRRGKYGIRATCRRVEIGKTPAEVRDDFAARRFF